MRARAAVCMLVGVVLVAPAGGPAGAVGFSNPTTITIPGPAAFFQADPYPSTIEVSGVGGVVSDLTVQLIGIAHTFPDDIDVLLVGPTGVKVILMSDVGSDDAISGVSVLIDDTAAASMPDTSQLFSGTYRPTTFGAGFDGTSPAPAGPYELALSAFDGTSPNGTWSLFVYDDANAANTGSISVGWSFDVATAPTITSFAPTSGTPGTSVTITGSGLTGATSVTFGGAPATFTVDSDTEITATAPAEAETGLIAVVTPSGTGTSADSFTVVSLEHHRSVSMSVGRKARGTVVADDDFAACESEVPVRVQHRERGRWRTIGTDITDTNGGFVVPGTREAGRYRAIASRVTLSSDDVCLKATSPAVSN
jgi:subtilisin-like proprotein convertase family protein